MGASGIPQGAAPQTITRTGAGSSSEGVVISEAIKQRLSDLHKERVEKGARRYLETKRKAEEVVGFGGVKLSRREKADLYLQAALDPMGQQMTEILMRRQQANKLGPQRIPRDWWEWTTSNWAKHQEGKLMPSEGEEEA